MPVQLPLLLRVALPFLMIILMAAGSPSRAADGSSAQWTILESSEDGLTIEVQIPRPLLQPGRETGWSLLDVRGASEGTVVGAPDLPHFTRKVAVPAGRIVNVRILDRTDGALLAPITLQPVPEPGLVKARAVGDAVSLPVSNDVYTIDRAYYDAPYPQSWATVSSRARLRFLEVATIAVYPYRWVPALDGVQLLEKLTLRVDFTPDPAAARSAVARTAMPRDHQSWDSLLRNQILNSADVSRFRSRPARLPRASRSVGGRGPEYRLGILESGIQIVSYDDLPASTGPWPLDQIAILEKGFEGSASPYLEVDVPSWIEDRNSNGQFDSGDHVYFYGQNYADRFLPAPRDARYGNEHAYWLTIRDEGGVRTTERSSTLNQSGLTPETSFVSQVRIDRNRHFRRFLTRNESNRIIFGTGGISTDHTIWLGLWPTFGTPDADEFDLPGFLSARSLKFLVHHFEVSPSTAFFTVRIGGSFDGSYELPRFSHPAREVITHSVGVDQLAQIPFREGQNYIGVEIQTGEQAAGIEAMECEYDRSFRAFKNRIDWHTEGLEGDREFVIDGLDSETIVLFDVSDPRRPVRLTYTPDQLVDTGNGQGLRVQMTLAEQPLRFAAVTESGALRPASIELRDVADLWGTPENEYLIIVHDEFSETLEPYATERQSQGWNLQVAEMRDVADLFDHGRSSPLAIRRYLRFLFASLDTPPSYLLLVGDGSEDHQQAEEFVGRIYVPTQTIPAEAELSADGPEVSVSDHWFVDNLTGLSDSLDFVPDMHIGRFPVKTKSELEILIQKVHDYEQFGTDDTWRSRLLFVADDEFSTTLGGSESYTNRGRRPSGGESVFRFGAREARRIIHESIGFENLQVDSMFLATYLDTFACAERCILIENGETDCNKQICKIDEHGEADGFRGGTANLAWAERQTRLVNMPILRQMKSGGYLVVAVQSHANRHLVAHESLWVRAAGIGEDHNGLTNINKPFIYLGFGCHMSEFGEHVKQRSGNSLVEAMLYLPNGRGAIAGIASGSYEWLSANDEYQQAIAQAWFADPPTDGEGRARWILGEMFTASKFDLIGRPFGQGMVASYGLLGDPTLTVEIGAPRLQQVRVNDMDWDGTSRVQARAGSDSLQIDVTMFDEVWIQSVEVFGENGRVPASEYDLTWPIGTADGDTLFREAVLSYRLELDLPAVNYDIVVRGTDRNGLSREVLFPVAFDAQFEVERKGDRQPLLPGNFVAGQDSIFVTVMSPIDLNSGLSIRLNGEEIPSRAVRLDDAGREWEVAAELPAILGRSSEVRIGVGAVGRSGAIVERAIEALTASAEVDIVALFNFPNPFTDETRIMYDLSAFATSARVQIFTLRGREIRSLEGPVQLNRNEILWDGTDEDGDAVSNGVYFFRLEVESLSGEKIERIERIARVR